ncbi:MAG: T9SS C-terminal target domain-containing protein, partial [Calditrichaeota bacterium]
HNRTLAWSFTSNKPDHADAYLVTLDPQNPDAYLIDGQPHPFTVWQEVIEIANAPDTTFTFRNSPHHGLVIRQISPTQVLCARLELVGKEPPARQTLAMMRSATVAQFINAMQMHLYARANTVAADAWGNLYYLYGARVHWRNDPRAARQGPLDGSNSQNLWGDQIPFAQLPTVLNPATGYLQNCNDAPWYVTENPGFDSTDVPVELVYGDHFGVRGQRATELILAGGNAIDSTYCRRIALDTKIVQWDSVDTVLQVALQEARQDSLPRVAYADSLAAGLFRWDGFAHRSSTEMGLFTQWFLQLRDEVDFLNPDGIDYSQRRRMVEELIAAGDSLQALYGTEWVPWADIHGFERGGSWFGLSGGDHKLPTARMGTFTVRNGVRRYRVYGGNNFMMIIRLKQGESPQAWTMKPFGQSEDPASPHYTDLTTLYSLDSLRNTYYEEADFRAHAELIVFYTVTGIASGDEATAPREFALAVAPNPFNPATTVRFSLPQASPTRVVVYNLLGQKVTTLLDRRLAAGHYQVRWQPQGATASGLYFIRLETDFGQRTVRAVLLK